MKIQYSQRGNLTVEDLQHHVEYKKQFQQKFALTIIQQIHNYIITHLQQCVKIWLLAYCCNSEMVIQVGYFPRPDEISHTTEKWQPVLCVCEGLWHLFRICWGLTQDQPQLLLLAVCQMPPWIRHTEDTFWLMPGGIFGSTYHMSHGKRLNKNYSALYSSSHAQPTSIPSCIRMWVLSCKMFALPL